MWRGKQLKIIEAEVAEVETSSGKGQVFALPGRGAGLGIGTGDGTLGVLRVQLEGKKAMTGAEFLRGQRDFAGAVLPS
jgi:methionyl-tRNA formyltransferase